MQLPPLFTTLLLLLISASNAADVITRHNPYEQGCFYALSEMKLQSIRQRFQKRVCNSEDDFANTNTVCRPAQDPAVEIRVLSSNYQAALAQAWILQILLSELLQVPSTIESGSSTLNLNFYHPIDSSEIRYVEPQVFSEALQQFMTNLVHFSRNQMDCRHSTTLASSAFASSTMCFHMMPQVWESELQNMLKKVWQKEPSQELSGGPSSLSEVSAINSLLEISSLGMLANQGWFVPKRTGLTAAFSLSYLGMSGATSDASEDLLQNQLRRRQQLSEMFPTPLTWQDYCSNVHPTMCVRKPGDNITYGSVAKRPPQPGTDEGSRLFVEGLYTGYFQILDSNNCTKYPTTCTGTLVDFPCGWTSYAYAQIYHNNISLTPLRLTYRQMTEAWLAAANTNNNIIMNWWSPESLKQTFQGSNYEFVEVILPTPTQECMDHRLDKDAFCPSSNAATQSDTYSITNDTDNILYGDPRGACDVPPQLLQKFVLKGLLNVTRYDADGKEIPEAIRSPAYEILNSFTMTEAQLASIFTYWENYGTPRDAICNWVVDNFDTYMNTFIPPTYPRILFSQNDNCPIGPLMYFSMALGGFAALLVVVTGFTVWIFRDSLVFQFAQLEFLFLLLAGALTLAVGAIVEASPPTNVMCIASVWLVNIGYTMELVPLLIKVAALNKLHHAATRMRRVTLRRSTLLGAVAIIVLLVLVYLALWTGLDRPQVAAEYEITDTVTNEGETVVKELNYCRSDYMVWYYISVGWNVVLLFAATVLAVQTRTIKQEFNESRTLGILIYSHMVFVVLRTVTFFLPLQQAFLLQSRSIIFAVDTLATLVIYFLPKFLARNHDISLTEQSEQRTSIQNQSNRSGNISALSVPVF